MHEDHVLRIAVPYELYYLIVVRMGREIVLITSQCTFSRFPSMR